MLDRRLLEACLDLTSGLRRGSTDLVLSEEDNSSNDEGRNPTPGTLLIPAEAPPGWYRAGGGPNGERGADFEVTP